MSLNVPSHLLAQVEQTGQISLADFVGIVQESFPALWKLCVEITMGQKLFPHSAHRVIRRDAMGDEGYPQVLRGMASTAVHAALDEHFNGRFFLLEKDVFAFFDADFMARSPEAQQRYFHDVLHIETMHRCGKDGGDNRVKQLKESHPLGFARVERLARAVVAEGHAFDNPAHLDEAERVQVLELMAIHLNRRAIEWEYGQIELGFVNCCGSIGTHPKNRSPEQFKKWQNATSRSFQILSQSPVRRDC